MILTRESRRTWWLVMIGAWALAAVLATLHAFAMRDYVGLLDRGAARVPPISTPLRHIIPTNYADAQNWVRYALTFDGEAPSRVRYTYNDNAPDGREVHWSSGFAHLVAGAGRLRQGVTGEPLPLATERVLPWFNLPLLMAAVIFFSAWVGRRAGAGAGALVAVGIVGTEGFYGVFAPYYVDHHGLLTAATFGVVLGAIFMGAGWWRAAVPGQDQLLPRSRAAARGAAIFSGACGALGLWISAFSTIPVIALTGFAGLVAAWSLRRVERRDGAEFDADLWRWWGRVGAAGSVAFYLFEYAPAHLGMRLEVNHPCYALAWWGGSELVALLAERRLAVVPVAPAWRFVWPGLALAAAPLTVLLGGARVFVVGDPFISEIPKTVAEGLSLAAATKAFGWPTFFHYINGNVAAFAVVAVLLLRRAPSQKPLLVFSAVVALGFLALLAAQIRWSFVASGPLLCLLLVVVAALVQGRSTRVRGLVVLAVGGAFFLPGAINRISAVQGRVALRAADQGDLQQLIYRDAAAAIRASQPTGEIVLLASPNGSTGMGYYGNFQTLGTLYWENYRGLRAAAEIFCAPTAERARELIRLHGVTHLALISEENYLAQYFFILHPKGTPEEFKKTFGYTLLSAQVLTPWLRPIPYRVPSEVKIPDLRVLLLQVVPDQTPADALWHIAIAQLTLGESANAVQSFSAAIMQSPAAQQVALCQAAADRRGAARSGYEADRRGRVFARIVCAGARGRRGTAVARVRAGGRRQSRRAGRVVGYVEPDDGSGAGQSIARVSRRPRRGALCAACGARVHADLERACRLRGGHGRFAGCVFRGFARVRGEGARNGGGSVRVWFYGGGRAPAVLADEAGGALAGAAVGFSGADRFVDRCRGGNAHRRGGAADGFSAG